jgi:hypothetical protein
MKSEHSILTKSHEQLQIQLTKNDVPSSSTSTCDHANNIEENARLTDELAKSTIPISEKKLNDILSKQKAFNDKTGTGFVSKKKKKTTRKRRPSPHKQRRIPLCMAKPLMMILQELLTTTMFYFVIIMVMCMQNMLVQMMVMFLGLFGFQRPLLLTKEDPLRKWGPNPKQCSLVGLCFRWIKMGA